LISSYNNNFIIKVNSASNSCWQRAASALILLLLLLCWSNLQLCWPNCAATLVQNLSSSTESLQLLRWLQRDRRNEPPEELSAIEAVNQRLACDWINSIVSRSTKRRRLIA